VLFPLVAMLSGLPILGWAKPVPVDPRHLRNPRRDFAVIAAAGPASNLVLATLAAALLMAVEAGRHEIVGNTELVLLMAVRVNVILAIFNMIPVPPLDGGNVAIGLLPAPIAHVFAQIRPYGFLILYALMLTGTLGYLLGPVAYSILRVLLRIP